MSTRSNRAAQNFQTVQPIKPTVVNSPKETTKQEDPSQKYNAILNFLEPKAAQNKFETPKVSFSPLIRFRRMTSRRLHSVSRLICRIWPIASTKKRIGQSHHTLRLSTRLLEIKLKLHQAKLNKSQK